MRSNGRTSIQERRSHLCVRTSTQNLWAFLSLTGDIFAQTHGDIPPKEPGALPYNRHLGEGILRYCAENDDWD